MIKNDEDDDKFDLFLTFLPRERLVAAPPVKQSVKI